MRYKISSILTALTSLCLFATTIQTVSANENPMNVLLIAVDDMNDWIEPLNGHPQSITPNIKRLAESGMLFTNAHTSSPACHSSRVALMTGVQPAKSGVVKNVFAKGEVTWRKAPLLKEATTLSQHFRNSGYEAIAGGKIYHTLQNNPSDENDYTTWDYIMQGDKKSGSPIAYQPRATQKNVEPEQEKGLVPNRIMSWSPMAQPVEKMADNQLVNWAIDELNKPRTKPLFMAVGIFRPHLPWEVPVEFYQPFPIDSIQLPVNDPYELIDTADHGRRHWHKWVMDNDLWKSGVQSYLASVHYADYEVGRLLDALKASGKADNTIVVLWSDHGMHIGDKENWEKFTLYEESTRIPFIIRDPRQKAGKNNSPVASIDLFPTLIELAELPLNTNQVLDGESMGGLVQGKANDKQPAISTFEKRHSVRSERYRYIYSEDVGVEELYDHQIDPAEKTNIAYSQQGRAILIAHRALLTQHTHVKTPIGFNVPKDYKQLSNGKIEKLNFKLLKDVPYVINENWPKAQKDKLKKQLTLQGVIYAEGQPGGHIKP